MKKKNKKTSVIYFNQFYTQKNNYSEAKFLEQEHFFIAILILEQFYNAKKKKEFLLIFEAIFRFLFVKVF
jgi:hypothetical protein